jgi:hypothetical protein
MMFAPAPIASLIAPARSLAEDAGYRIINATASGFIKMRLEMPA